MARVFNACYSYFKVNSSTRWKRALNTIEINIHRNSLRQAQADISNSTPVSGQSNCTYIDKIVNRQQKHFIGFNRLNSYNFTH